MTTRPPGFVTRASSAIAVVVSPRWARASVHVVRSATASSNGRASRSPTSKLAVGTLRPGVLEHLRRGVDTPDVVTEVGEDAADPPGPARGVDGDLRRGRRRTRRAARASAGSSMSISALSIES